MGDLHTGRMESPQTRHRVTAMPSARAAHAARPTAPPARIAFAVLTLAAVGLAAGLGVATLLRKAGSANSNPTSAKLMTVPPDTTPGFPLTGDELAALADSTQDLGRLADPERLKACLQGLGYPPSISVRGGRQVQVDGRPAVILLLPGPGPDRMVARAVRPDCNAADSAMVADTTVVRP